MVKGNLQVDGTQTTVNSSTMTVTDKNIEMAVGAANDAAADGGGITVKSGDGDKTWRWLNGTDSWTSSEHVRIPDDKVFGFASDTNTYIGRPAADTIAFTHGGDEKVRITSDGKVGIGTNNPTQKLDVRGNGVFLNSGNDTNISIGGTVGNNNAYLDFIGDATYTDYGLRVLRNDGGANATSDFRHRGTGSIRIVAEDAGSIQFLTSGTASSNERLLINSTGTISIPVSYTHLTLPTKRIV